MNTLGGWVKVYPAQSFMAGRHHRPRIIGSDLKNEIIHHHTCEHNIDTMPLVHRSTFLIGFLAFGWIRAVKSQATDVGAFCNLCKNGGFPGNPSTVTAVRFIDGNPTCRDLYNLGQNSQIPSRLCKPIQNSILQEDCGCNQSTTPPAGGGGSPQGVSASPPDTSSAVPAVTVPTVPNFNGVSSVGTGVTGGSVSSPNAAGNAAGNVGFSPPAGNTGASFVPFVGIDFSGVGPIAGVGVTSGIAVAPPGNIGSIAGVGATSGIVAPTGNISPSNIGELGGLNSGNIGLSNIGELGGLNSGNIGLSNIGELGGLNSGSFDVSAALDSFKPLTPVPLP
jgi:hypothetical protein